MTNTTTTTNEKVVRVTKTQRFDDAIAMVQGKPVVHGSTVEDLIAFFENEQRLLANKNKTSSGEKKLTPTQVQNNKDRAILMDYLRNHPKQTCTQIIKGIPEFDQKSFTPSKVSALIRPLMDNGSIVSDVIKGRSYFSVVTLSNVDE